MKASLQEVLSVGLSAMLRVLVAVCLKVLPKDEPSAVLSSLTEME
jgi:hypothetical protein